MRAPHASIVVALVTLLLGIVVPAPGLVPALPPLQEDDELWVDRYDPPGKLNDARMEPLVAPDGSTVYSVGLAMGEDKSFYRVVAFDPATGEQRWVVERPGNIEAAALSPDGSRIYLAGAVSDDEVTSQDWIVYALDSSSGDEIWSSRHREKGDDDLPNDLAVSPDGAHVYVVGRTLSALQESHDMTTLALSAASGEEEWSDEYGGPAGDWDEATAVAVAPSGELYVTGFVTRRRSKKYVDDDTRYTTIAYGNGANPRFYGWVSWYNGPGRDSGSDAPEAIATDGEAVYITGESAGASDNNPDWLTVAYEADVGAELWLDRYDHRRGARDQPYGMALAPNGKRVFVTGASGYHDLDAQTIAYRTRDGSRAWRERFDGPGKREELARDDLGWDVAVSPDGDRVYVGIESSVALPRDADFVTHGYSARDGELEWWARYGGPNASWDAYPTIAVHPDSERVFVVGREWDHRNIVFTTIAYEPSGS